MTSGLACSSSFWASPSPAITLPCCPSSTPPRGCAAIKGTCEVAMPATISAMTRPSFLAWLVHRFHIRTHIIASGHGIHQQEKRIRAHVVEFPHLPAFDGLSLLRRQLIVLQHRLHFGTAALGQLSVAVGVA